MLKKCLSPGSVPNFYFSAHHSYSLLSFFGVFPLPSPLSQFTGFDTQWQVFFAGLIISYISPTNGVFCWVSTPHVALLLSDVPLLYPFFSILAWYLFYYSCSTPPTCLFSSTKPVVNKGSAPSILKSTQNKETSICLTVMLAMTSAIKNREGSGGVFTARIYKVKIFMFEVRASKIPSNTKPNLFSLSIQINLMRPEN